MSTEMWKLSENYLGPGAQDAHLFFYTAPELFGSPLNTAFHGSPLNTAFHRNP